MKLKFNYLLGAFALCGLLTFTSCSDDEEEVQVFPTLPESVENAAVGQEGKITFNAYADWSLSADKSWVKLKDVSGTAEWAQSVSGKPGSQVVAFKITDDAMEFEATSAVITLRMDGQTATMSVSRQAKERSFSFFSVVYDAEGKATFTEAQSLDFAYNKEKNAYQAQFAVRTNSKWAVKAPEWVNVAEGSESGEPNESVAADQELKVCSLEISKEKAAKNDMEGKLEFVAAAKDAEAGVLKSVVVKCKGTSSWSHFTSAVPEIINYTAEGKYEGEDSQAARFEFSTFTGSDNEFVFYILPKEGDKYGVEDNAGWFPTIEFDARELGWFGVDKKKGAAETIGNTVANQYEIWANPMGGEKTDHHGVLFAIPASEANTIKFAKNLVDEDTRQLRAEYEKYIVSEIMQHPVVEPIVTEIPDVIKFTPDGRYDDPATENKPKRFEIVTQTKEEDTFVFFVLAKEGDKYGVEDTVGWFPTVEFDARDLGWFGVDLQKNAGDKKGDLVINHYELWANPVDMNAAADRQAALFAIPSSRIGSVRFARDLVNEDTRELRDEYKEFEIADILQPIK